MRIEQLIKKWGVRKIARVCGVDPAAVVRWRTRGHLPAEERYREQRALYERRLAKLEGMKVKDLRKQIAEEEEGQAA